MLSLALSLAFVRQLLTRTRLPISSRSNFGVGIVQEFKKEGVVCIARACEPTYSIEPLTQEGIEVEEFAFPDGSHPSKDVVNRWVRLVRNTYKRKEAKDIAVGVHCVAGLGRAPVLVRACALLARCSSLSNTKQRSSSWFHAPRYDHCYRNYRYCNYCNYCHCRHHYDMQVAIALIEDGMDPIQAVEVIRNARRGSINTTQLNWLKDYRPKAGGCIAM